jgi:hypothetical protein
MADDAPPRSWFEPSSGREWPLGPNYLSHFPSGTKNYVSWSRFRVMAGTWYLDTLKVILARTNDLDRFVGVEMALDGFFAGMSSAFDAAVGGLCTAIEANRGVAEADRTPDHQKNWRRVKLLAAQPPAIALSSMTAVDDALQVDPKTDEPTGWLAQLRRARNRMVHGDTLTRAFFRNVSEPSGTGSIDPSKIGIPGVGKVEPIGYMEAALTSTTDLVELILSDAALLDP